MELIRFPQPGRTECGPASVCAAASVYPDANFNITSLIDAAGIAETIIQNGSNVAQLSVGVDKLSNGKLSLIYKQNGTIQDIKELVEQGIPVIVDWQGSSFKASDGGYGHYGVVSAIDDKELILIDSLVDFPQPRHISISEFTTKWNDWDSIVGPDGNSTDVITNNLLFIIIPAKLKQELISKYNLRPGAEYPL